MSAENPRPGEVLSLAAVAIVVCCATPAVITAGAGLTILGLGVRSWLAFLAGVAVITFGALRWRTHRACVTPDAAAPDASSATRDVS